MLESGLLVDDIVGGGDEVNRGVIEVIGVVREKGER